MKKGGNAGLFVWSDAVTAPGVPFTRSIEVQIIDGDDPGGNWTLSVNVAIATVRYLIRHQTKLLDNVATMSDYFRGRLSQMEFESPASINILGLAIGIDFDDEEYANKVAARCQRKGLLVAPQDTGILLIPALNIEYEVAEKALDIFEESI